ncbi:MAG TPA: MFS transporter, partial [Solirubrobacteraceae bacterium]|nr:MFS transporter [Solirubrobacteraceae bacterium]
MSASRRAITAPGTVLAVASLGVFMAFVDATIVNIAFPSIERSFPRSSLSGLSWVLNAYNIVFAALMIGAGRIADLIGRRRVFRVGLVVFTVASGACALAPSPTLLILFRIVQATGAAVLVPCSLGLVLQAFPEERRGHAVAMWTATAALAAGVGPSLGGVLVSAANWRLAFVANLPIGALAYYLAGQTLVESRMPGRRRLPDLAGALIVAVALGALTLGIVQGTAWGWSNVRTLTAFIAAAALLVVFLERCRRHPTPVIDLGLLRIRNVGARQRADGALRHRLLRLHAVQRALPHLGLALLGTAGRPRPHPRAVRRCGGGPSEQPSRRTHWLPARRRRRGADVGGGADLVHHAGGSETALREPMAAGDAPARPGSGGDIPERFERGRRLGPRRALRDRDGDQLGRRQLGAVLGVATLVAIIGGSAHSVATFRGGWWLGVGCFGLMALGALAL